jgi:SET and MYND domain-containing protein 4
MFGENETDDDQPGPSNFFDAFDPDLVYRLLRIDSKSNNSDIRAIEERENGNRFFRKELFFEALLSYNKSLCYAVSPQSRSLAYANRSAVFLELKFYSKCLQNIQWARDNQYPSDKIKKLDEREQKCNEFFDPTKDEFQNIPYLEAFSGIHDFFKLSHPANEKIPFIVNCLELKWDDKYGRGIYATKDLKAGDIIAIDEIFIKFFDFNFSYRRCFTCMSTNMLSLIPCVYLSKFS